MRTCVAGLLLGGALLLSACGGDVGDSTSRPTDPPTPSPSLEEDGTGGSAEPPEPTLTAKPDGQSVRLTGTVRVAPEDRCTLLTGSDPQPQGTSTWVLVGELAGLTDGRQVTLTGRIDPGATSRCQQGPVLVVTGVDGSTS